MMNNFKIPYLIYPVIIGLMAGWLVSAIAGGVFVRPRPLPVVKSRQVAKLTPAPKLEGTVIADNIFGLDLLPAPMAPDGASADGSYGFNPDGTPITGQSGVPPPPPFNAKLLGVLKNTNNENGIAIISLDEGTVSIKLGDEKHGIKVASLEDFSAIVEKQRRKYTLILENAVGAGGKKETAKSGTNSSAPQQSGSNINVALKRDEVRSELQDINKILQSALVSPFYDGGQFLGYRITRMREDSPLRKLGLMPGDTITRINGNELGNSPEMLFGMLSQMDDISAISLDMIRNTEKKTLFVEIQ